MTYTTKVTPITCDDCGLTVQVVMPPNDVIPGLRHTGISQCPRCGRRNLSGTRTLHKVDAMEALRQSGGDVLWSRANDE